MVNPRWADPTCDPARRSWLDSANQAETDFPIQNLPYGVFSEPSDGSQRVGVAIGDQVLDLARIEAAGLLPVPAGTFAQPRLNGFMALGKTVWQETRAAISDLLEAGGTGLKDNAELAGAALVPQAITHLHLPFEVTEFTDFYASREHATNVGTMFRDPDNALMPNWLHIPIGYNGRASTVVVSGTDIRRPMGQIKPPNSDLPKFAPSAKLDIELEMGAIVGTSSTMGTPLSVTEADDMIFGFVLLNDWSARDIQVWEYQPLGPFQAKAFATTISPWVVTRQALEAFRVVGPDQDPEPLPYLKSAAPCNFDIDLEVAMDAGTRGDEAVIARTNFRSMYWSSAQQLVHHAASGCAMRTGDLLGSGTISGAEPGTYGSLLELTWNGRDPLELPSGDRRTFIEDGDTLVLRGHCRGDGYRIGFGEARGRVVAANRN